MLESIGEVLDRLPDVTDYNRRDAGDAEQAAAREAEQRQRELERRKQLFFRCIGGRYWQATLDNYEVIYPQQRETLAALRTYGANLKAEVKDGRGILLFGTSGTGKDHLLIGLARQAIVAGCSLVWTNGMNLYAKMREAIADGRDEDWVLQRYMKEQVLVLSDPLPPSGPLTDYQAATMYRLIDHRYRNLLPVWCSLNVVDAKEARERLGAATVDRLRDGALAIECKWPSYRKAKSETGRPPKEAMG